MHQSKKWVDSSHPQMFCTKNWSLDLNKTMGFPISLRLCFAYFALGLCPCCAYAQKNRFAHFTTDVFCRTVSLFQLCSELLHATTFFCNPDLSVSHRGSPFGVKISRTLWFESFPTLVSLYPPWLTKRATIPVNDKTYSFSSIPSSAIYWPSADSTVTLCCSLAISIQSTWDWSAHYSDPYSERFGLRKDRLKALERAHFLPIGFLFMLQVKLPILSTRNSSFCARSWLQL